MKKISGTVYELIPPQEMIQFMLKYSFFHKQVTQIPESIIVSKEIDFDLMKKAFNIEIERNDCLRLRLFKEKGRIKQYFLDEYKLDEIPVINFKSEKERIDTLTADARRPIKMLKGETFRVKFFRTHDNRCGVYINIHHLVMDNAAVFTFFADLFAIYDSLKDGAAMPKPLGKYEDIIKKSLRMPQIPKISKRKSRHTVNSSKRTVSRFILALKVRNSLKRSAKRRKTPI